MRRAGAASGAATIAGRGLFTKQGPLLTVNADALLRGLEQGLGAPLDIVGGSAGRSAMEGIDEVPRVSVFAPTPLLTLTIERGPEDQQAVHVHPGGQGAWGPIPMPPNPVTEEEALTLAEWVLSLK